MYASSTIDKKSGEVIIKVVNSSSSPASYQVNLQGVNASKAQASLQMLTSEEEYAYNTLDQQQKIYPKEIKVNIKDNKIELMLQPMSVNVIRVACKAAFNHP